MLVNLKLRAHSADYRNCVEFLLVDKSNSENIGIAKPIEIEAKPKSQYEGMLLEPTFRLSISAAQLLMDDLWQAGLRPSEGTGSAGALAAVQKHLKDMRAIALHKLGIKE